MWLLVVILTLIIGIFINRRIKRMSILAVNGIPGPKPNLIFGNLFEMRELSSIDRQKAWIERYGKIVGCYSGAKQIVLVADPELAKNIQIKDFQYFTDRPHMNSRYLYPNPKQEGNLIRVCGNRWKQIRSVLTPTFSASKLKTMTSIIDDSIETFLEIIDNNSNSDQEFNIYELFQALSADVIIRTAFGVKTDVQRHPNNKFFIAVKDVFNHKLNKWVYLAISCFPTLDNIIYPFRRLLEIIKHRTGRSSNGLLLDMCFDIIKSRKENPSLCRKDLLQLMLDLNISNKQMLPLSDQSLTAGYDENENYIQINKNGDKSKLNSNKNNIHITDNEIIANCVLFYEAGFETTSTALGFITHILVNYPETQERIREEVKHLYESEGKLDFNTVNKLEFMEWVLNETLRLYPPIITLVARECLTDYKYNHMTIPKGATVAMATHYLHHDPDYWEEPKKFDPFRFSPERRSEIHWSSWQPFGNGPRNCVGMRFALFEIKLTLAKLLINYRLERGDNTEIGELTTQCKLLVLSPKNGVFVKAIKL